MTDRKKNNVFVITHKVQDVFQGEGYTPLFVGAYDKITPHGFLRDDVGNNISQKNKSYCELTGLYWIWKNVQAEHIGLVHYRRFFGRRLKGLKIRNHYLVCLKKRSFNIFTIEELEKMLDKNDLLVKEKTTKNTTFEEVSKMIGKEICQDVKKTIIEIYPEYKETFEREIKTHTHFNCNMFYGKKDVVDQYCEWLFSVLENVEKCYFEREHKVLCNREIGYIGEMLFKVWIVHNNIHYKPTETVCFNELCNIWEYMKLLLQTLRIWRDGAFENRKDKKCVEKF